MVVVKLLGHQAGLLADVHAIDEVPKSCELSLFRLLFSDAGRLTSLLTY